ncbi:MAG: hypothetical protein HY928_04465 [Elusimicrobia bacterium]|nr:hypothetical protein [Elusimicrobiota bacterium]
MAPEPENRGPILALVVVMGLSGLAASFVMLRGGTAAPAPPAKARAADGRPARAWPDSEAPEVPDASMISQAPERSSIDLVARPEGSARDERPGGEAKTASASEGTRAAKPAAAPGPGPGAAGGLSDDEKSMMGEVAGRDLTDPRKAKEVAASDPLWSAAIKALAGYPRLMAYILNNDTVVKAFMSRPTSQKNCNSASAFTSYLSDTKRPRGVSHAMDVFDKVLHASPENPTVIFSSKLAGAYQECPSVKAIVKDPVAIGSIAQSNTRMLGMMMDPAIMKGLAANPAALASFQSVQNTLGQ